MMNDMPHESELLAVKDLLDKKSLTKALRKKVKQGVMTQNLMNELLKKHKEVAELGKAILADITRMEGKPTLLH